MAVLSNRMAYLFLVLATFLWAGNYVSGKMLTDHMMPQTILFIRSIAATVVLLIFGFSCFRKNLAMMWQYKKILFILGATGGFVFSSLGYVSLSLTTVINASLMIAFCPALVAVMLHVLGTERLTISRLFYCFISLLGVLTILLKGDMGAVASLNFQRGDIAAVLAVCAWAVYCVFIPHKPKELSNLALLQSQAIVSTLLSGVAMFSLEWGHILVVDYTPAVVAGLVYLVFLSFILGYYLYNRGALVLGGFIASVFFNCVPLFASILGIIVLGENLAGYHVVGGVLLFISVYQLSIKKALQQQSL